MGNLLIYRNTSIQFNLPADSADYSGQVMGEDKVSVDFTKVSPIDFKIGDYIVHRSKKYAIFVPPVERKDSNQRFAYQVMFEAPEYALYNKKFRHLNSGTFSFSGTCYQMIDLVCQVAGGLWHVGNVDVTLVMTIDFAKDSCRTAITKIAQAFGLEFQFNIDYSIDVKETIGAVLSGITLSYGKGNGLKPGLVRQPVSDGDFGTRFFGYGSSENLPAGYRGGATQLQFEGYSVDTSNIADYPEPIERDVEFPDIRPEYTGLVNSNASYGTEEWTITDPSINFDLNAQIISDSARIVFKSGVLAGNEFKITNYNNTTKTVRFLVNKEDSGYILPNITIHPNLNDEYTFIGIVMPNSYIIAAEARLLAATIDYAQKNSTPKVSYGLVIDELYMRRNGISELFNSGDKIRVVDVSMGIDVVLRINQINYPIFNPSNITATISETVNYTAVENRIIAIKTNTQKIDQLQPLAQQAAREADNAARTSSILSRKTNFLTTTIDGNVIATGTLGVGNASGDNNAGITGVTLPIIGDSVRFWAGDTFDNRATAPFRVLQDGSTYMTKARISGDVIIGTKSGTTPSGYSRGWTLSEGAILSDGGSYPSMVGGNNFALIRGTSKYPGDKYNEFAFGTELVPGTTGGSVSQTAYIHANRPELGSLGTTTRNIALELDANGADENVALSIVNGGVMVNGSMAWSGTIQIVSWISGSSDFRQKIDVKNGIITNVYI